MPQIASKGRNIFPGSLEWVNPVSSLLPGELSRFLHLPELEQILLNE